MGNPRRRRRRNQIRGIVSRDTAARIDSCALDYQRRRTEANLRRICQLLNSFTQGYSKLVVEELHLYLLNKWDPRKASYVRYFQKYGSKLLRKTNKTYLSAWSKEALRCREYIPPDIYVYPYESFETVILSKRLGHLEQLIAKDLILNEYTLKELSEAYNMSYRSLRVMTSHILRILAEEHIDEARR